MKKLAALQMLLSRQFPDKIHHHVAPRRYTSTTQPPPSTHFTTTKKKCGELAPQLLINGSNALCPFQKNFFTLCLHLP